MLEPILAQLNMPIQPEQASEFSKSYDVLFYTTSALTVLFTVIVMSMVVIFAIRYRHGRKADRSNPPTSHMALELTWTIVPVILSMVMFFWSASLFVQERIPPKDAQEIYVVGKQWMWHIQHPNGVRENNELHVPIGKDIKLVMISQDVIHSFFIPAFRMKQDVLPGRYTMQWFKAIKIGKYPIFCAEYCGTQHSEMGGYVYVMSQADYDKWLSNGGEALKATEATPIEAGKALYERFRCGTCHTSADTDRSPTLYGLIGKKRDFVDGESATADRQYVRESIIEPGKHLVKGYEDTMAPYKDEITEDELLTLFEYIKSLGAPSERTPPKTIATANEAGKRP